MEGLVCILVLTFLIPKLEAASWTGNFTDISQQHPSLHDGISGSRTSINGPMEINNHLDNVCQDPFTMFGEYCLYYDYDTYGNHSTMASTCASLGATLAYPTGDLAQWQAAIAHANTRRAPWVGATRDQTSDTWLWVTGTVVPPGAWVTGYPGGSGDCAVAHWDDGLLFDVSCSSSYPPLLCQVSDQPTTTSTTATTTTTTITSSTDAPTTTAVEILECYSCFKCPDVDSNTTVVDAGSHSCFTSLYAPNPDIVNRGIAAELHIDGECEFINDATVCYCNTQLCNDQHVLKSFTQNIG